MCTNSINGSTDEQQSPNPSRENSNIQDLRMTNIFMAYEKAINGYQFQVNRYNVWMNYYALFVGALFIALYSVWPKEEINNVSIVCDQCILTPSKNIDWVLPFVVSVMGWITSLCWYASLLGYRKWNGHWIGVIQEIEKIFTSNDTLDNNRYFGVYSRMPQQESVRTGNNTGAGTGNNDTYLPGYVSTQKITGVFIFFVIVAWCVVISLWCSVVISCNFYLLFFLIFAISFAIVMAFHCMRCIFYSSTLKR